MFLYAPNVDITRRSGFREFFETFSEVFQKSHRFSSLFHRYFRTVSEAHCEVGWVGGLGGRKGSGQTVTPKNKTEILGATERHSGWRQTLQQTALSKAAAEERFADLADLHQSKSENYEVHHGIP